MKIREDRWTMDVKDVDHERGVIDVKCPLCSFISPIRLERAETTTVVSCFECHTPIRIRPRTWKGRRPRPEPYE